MRGGTLRIMSYNVRYGGAGREAALAAVINAAAPDVVVLQEASNRDVVARLAERTEMPVWGSQPGASTGFLSRHALAHHAWHHPRGARHAFLELVLAHTELRLFGLHLTAWFSKWTERRRELELRALLEGIREHQHGFHIIAGDFNALAPGERLHVARLPTWIRAMVWLSGRDIARDTIQLMLDQRYVDAWRRLHPGEDGYTFPTWDPHVRLDYMFVPQAFADRVRCCSVFREQGDARGASDHYPLVAELELETVTQR
jgi:endonuclease/exonuclease/phosphatase family metal-dependent hydrolase